MGAPTGKACLRSFQKERSSARAWGTTNPMSGSAQWSALREHLRQYEPDRLAMQLARSFLAVCASLQPGISEYLLFAERVQLNRTSCRCPAPFIAALTPVALHLFAVDSDVVNNSSVSVKVGQHGTPSAGAGRDVVFRYSMSPAWRDLGAVSLPVEVAAVGRSSGSKVEVARRTKDIVLHYGIAVPGPYIPCDGVDQRSKQRSRRMRINVDFWLSCGCNERRACLCDAICRVFEAAATGAATMADLLRGSEIAESGPGSEAVAGAGQNPGTGPSAGTSWERRVTLPVEQLEPGDMAGWRDQQMDLRRHRPADGAPSTDCAGTVGGEVLSGRDDLDFGWIVKSSQRVVHAQATSSTKSMLGSPSTPLRRSAGALFERLVRSPLTWRGRSGRRTESAASAAAWRAAGAAARHEIGARVGAGVRDPAVQLSDDAMTPLPGVGEGVVTTGEPGEVVAYTVSRGAREGGATATAVPSLLTIEALPDDASGYKGNDTTQSLRAAVCAMEIAVGGVSPPPCAQRTATSEPTPAPTQTQTTSAAAAEVETRTETNTVVHAVRHADKKALMEPATTVPPKGEDAKNMTRYKGSPNGAVEEDQNYEASENRTESEASTSVRADDSNAQGEIRAMRGVDLTVSTQKYTSSMAMLSPSDAGVETVGLVLRREAEEQARREADTEEQAQYPLDEHKQQDSGTAAAAAPCTPQKPPAAATASSNLNIASAAIDAGAGGGLPAAPDVAGAPDDVGAQSPLGRHVLPPARGSADERHPMHHTSSVQALELFC